jgi:hypothetical protein
VRHAPLAEDLVERVPNRRPVGHVDLQGLGALRYRPVLDVEAHDARPALGEPGEICLPELAHAAGHDRDTALEIEQRVDHAETSSVAKGVASTSTRGPRRYLSCFQLRPSR